MAINNDFEIPAAYPEWINHLDEIYAEYSAMIDKSELTDIEKCQAVINYVFRFGGFRYGGCEQAE